MYLFKIYTLQALKLYLEFIQTNFKRFARLLAIRVYRLLSLALKTDGRVAYICVGALMYGLDMV